MTDKTADNHSRNAVAPDLLNNGTAQVGGMVTTIALVGQAFASLNIHNAAAPLAAFVFAALLAVYQVSIVQKAPRKNCYILVPIATLVLFALSFAGNNSLAPDLNTASLTTQLSLTQEELNVNEEKLDNANELITQFQQALGLKGNDSSQTRQNSTPGTNHKRTILDWFVSSAIAQNETLPEPTPPEQQQKLSEALKNYQAQQQTLQVKQQRLERKRQEIQQQQPKASAWRQWRK